MRFSGLNVEGQRVSGRRPKVNPRAKESSPAARVAYAPMAQLLGVYHTYTSLRLSCRTRKISQDLETSLKNLQQS